MSQARERLGQLLALAADGRWTVLARQLADLVLDWPHDYPEPMRAPVVALLEWAARESDDSMHAELAARVIGHPELPLKLLNELYLAASAPLRREILMRNELEGDGRETVVPADAQALLTGARQEAVRDFASLMGVTFSIPRRIAAAILGDASGEALAVLCRGTGIDRATFSAIALLRGANGLPLTAYETVPKRAAALIVKHWRADHPYTHQTEAAA